MGVIHRDIKPANMLWTKGRARVKLTDFGVACFTKPLQGNYNNATDNSPSLDKDDRLNKTEGTPAFYAPEQAYSQNGLPVPTFKPGERPPGFKGNEIYPMTKALDIWAFGVSIYCFLFGRPPFWGDNVYALCNEILEKEYVIPENATADSLAVASGDADLGEALRLMQGMMTKPVYARMTIKDAKVSPWIQLLFLYLTITTEIPLANWRP
jgi:[calcium/calmodulin-dependent protein kinase] kinase